MEYLDLYDENKKLTGETIIRGSGKPQVPEGRYINIVLIFIRNSQGKFLLQMTSKEKGNVWATTGGHVKSGQTSKEAIITEVLEELGLDISDDDVKMIDSSIFGVTFTDVYYLNRDIAIENLVLQDEEVEYVKWCSVEEIEELIENDKLRKSNIGGFKKIINFEKNK